MTLSDSFTGSETRKEYLRSIFEGTYNFNVIPHYSTLRLEIEYSNYDTGTWEKLINPHEGIIPETIISNSFVVPVPKADLKIIFIRENVDEALSFDFEIEL
jgi:hypothetical protein